MTTAEVALSPEGSVVSKEGRKRRLPLLPVARVLEAQRTLTAVDRFATRHESPGVLLKARYYKDLIPLERPRPGEQYAFEVDLDLCTGCKACVSACHNLNGLDDGELWRTVGSLHGGTRDSAVQQTVTTSCHHCVEPACMAGCPTRAYEKDPVTGIVRHLDDQCFGCQYCTLMCPYDAPKYNPARGVVRKCDMCSQRLSHDEAPACVQACPNGAIAIRLVDRAAIARSGRAAEFLPGAPTPEHTLPATRYTTRRTFPRGLLPADYHTTRPEHSHPPLVVMLTLTQLAVGAFVLAPLGTASSPSPSARLPQAAFACVAALVALGASVFHLGRPLLAFRAVLGLGTSWLSREAVAFGVFAKLATAYALLLAAPLLPGFPGKEGLVRCAPAVEGAAAAFGVLGVVSSIMVYVATRREQWSAEHTAPRFFGTSLVLGAACVYAVARLGPLESAFSSPTLLALVSLGAFAKAALELAWLRRARSLEHSASKRMATVMLGELRRVTALRFVLLSIGGALVPFLVAHSSGTLARWLSVAMVVTLLGAELAERYLFFRAAPASRMPGAFR
jgi:Fe-S-cluster-containing dehydrogenase component/DMSO reductase anchor subunit